MATIKLCTDLGQSKKLAEILPLESADMSWVSNGLGKPFARTISIKGDPEELCACWSLAALLNYLREIDFFPNIEADEFSMTMNIDYYDEEEARPLAPVHNIKVEAESFIDACYEMILKLHEQNIL